MDRCYKQCVADNQREPLTKDLDQAFLELLKCFCEHSQPNIEQLLLQRLEAETRASSFRFLHELQEFMRYVDHPRVDNKRVIKAAAQLESELEAFRSLKDAVVSINQTLPLIEVIKKLVNLMRAPNAHRVSQVGQQRGSIVKALAREFQVKEEVIRERLGAVGYSEEALLGIPGDREPIIRRLYARELSHTISSSNLPTKSVEMLEELDWLNRQQLAKPPSSFEQQAPVLQHQLSSLLQQWNNKQPKYQLRLQKVQRFYQRMMEALLADEMRTGVSVQVCSYLKKNSHFRKSVLLNCTVLMLWITKRKMSFPLVKATLSLSEEDLEVCWRGVSYIVVSQSLELPASLRAFMFMYQQQILIIQRTLKDFILQLGNLDEPLEDSTRVYLLRMQQHVNLRCSQLTRHFRQDLLNFLLCNVQAIHNEANSGMQSPLFLATIDQFLLCCVYSGVLLKHGHPGNFNDLLNRYASLTGKQQKIGWVTPQMSIIDYYNKHYVGFLRKQGDLNSLIDRTPQDTTIREDFMEMLDYLS